METVYVVGFNLAVGCAFARAGGIVVGSARSLLKRRQFEVVHFGVVEAITLPEPIVLVATSYLLLVNRHSSSSVSSGEAIAALAGGLIALAGIALCVWTLLSWRELFVGHGVLSEQQLVTGGAYRLVRHPVYLGGLVIWCGLSLAFLGLPATAVTVLYVIPAYLLYIRSEEAMMLASFGERYRSYRCEVPMLLPHVRPAGRRLSDGPA
jgi:protein-S-isoprenylcysteine O-methyltransferase Ste14